MTHADNAAMNRDARGSVIRRKPKHTVSSTPYPFIFNEDPKGIKTSMWLKSRGRRRNSDTVKESPINT
jgi:hypothetical protein